MLNLFHLENMHVTKVKSKSLLRREFRTEGAQTHGLKMHFILLGGSGCMLPRTILNFRASSLALLAS